ncbi:MAG: Spy/CpxP family protein refolding chaperone [bacterium]
MHPGMMYWWKTHRGGGSCEAAAEFGYGFGRRRHRHREDREPHGHGEHHEHHEHREWPAWEAGHHDSELGGNAFGVRRPLRFLAYKLDLDEAQVAQLAAILNDLKTERAQGEVDGRRATAAFADALAGESFDTEKAATAGAIRVTSAEHLREAVVQALGRIHSLLRPEQRERLAYLIRTGTLQI